MGFPEAYDNADALPRVTSAAELRAHDGTMVVVVGTYAQRDVRMVAEPPPVHLGHVEIRLADATAVGFLTPWNKDAPRPDDEINGLVGREVEVVGTVFEHGVPHPKGGAAPAGPTVVDIRALRLAP